VQQVSGSVIEFLSQPFLEVMASTLCKSSSYEGVMHIDACIDELSGKIYLIESTPRYWASLSAALWCGVNFVQESLKYITITHGHENTNRLVGARAYTLPTPATRRFAMLSARSRFAWLSGAALSHRSLENIPINFWPI